MPLLLLVTERWLPPPRSSPQSLLSFFVLAAWSPGTSDTPRPASGSEQMGPADATHTISAAVRQDRPQMGLTLGGPIPAPATTIPGRFCPFVTTEGAKTLEHARQVRPECRQ